MNLSDSHVARWFSLYKFHLSTNPEGKQPLYSATPFKIRSKSIRLGSQDDVLTQKLLSFLAQPRLVPMETSWVP